MACNALLLARSAASFLNGTNAFRMASRTLLMAINGLFGRKRFLHGAILMTPQDSSLTVEEILQKTPRPESIPVHHDSMLAARSSFSLLGVSISLLGLSTPFTNTLLAVSGFKPLQFNSAVSKANHVRLDTHPPLRK